MSLCCNCNLLRESFPGATYDSNMCIVAPYSYVSGVLQNAIKMFGIRSYIDTLPDTVDAHRIKASIIASHGVDGGGIATEMVVHSFSC